MATPLACSSFVRSPAASLSQRLSSSRWGRVIGVATAVAKVDKTYLDLAVELGSRLERQIVRVVLGG